MMSAETAAKLAGFWPDRPRGGDVGGPNPALDYASELRFLMSGPGWYRTSDLPRVRRTLSH
jgi:hypothetical protein